MAETTGGLAMATTALWDFGDQGADAQALLPVVGSDAGPGGALAVVFAQGLHIGPGDDVFARFDDGAARLVLSLGEDGAVRAELGDGAAVFSTPDDFQSAGDLLRATLVWDATTGEARFVVENLFTEAVYHSPAQPMPPMPVSFDAPDFWHFPESGAETGFVGAITLIGFYDSPADAAQIVGHGVEAPQSAEGVTLDLDSAEATAAAEYHFDSAEEGGRYTLVFRALDVAQGGDSFRVLWNGEALQADGESTFFPASDTYQSYSFDIIGGSGDGTNRIVIAGQGGPGGVAIAIEDLRLVPQGPDAEDGAVQPAEDGDLVSVVIGIEGGTSAQPSSLGAYVVDPATGALGQPQILFEDTQSTLHGGTLSPGTLADFAVPSGAQVGIFVIGAGAMFNDFAALGPGTLAFLTAEGAPATLHDAEPLLYHTAPDGAQTLIDGPIFHAAGAGALNPDGITHLQSVLRNDDGTQIFGFSDAFGGTAAPMALLVSVDGRAAMADFLAPEGLEVAAPADTIVPLFAEDDAVGDMPAGGEGLLVLLPAQRVAPPPPSTDDMLHDEQQDSALAAPAPLRATAPAEDGAEISAELSAAVIVPCFTPGTLIDAAHGRVPVETLRPGDRVLTRDNGFQRIEWAGRKDVCADTMAQNPRFRGVRIRAGALGNGLPERDMIVSPQHRVLVIGPEAELMFGTHEVLVPAIHMIGIPGVSAETSDTISYVHIMCRRHEIVRSDALWTESFQPGDLSLAGLDGDQRGELLGLFPELAQAEGRENYVAARRSLHRYETLALMMPRRAPVRPRRPRG